MNYTHFVSVAELASNENNEILLSQGSLGKEIRCIRNGYFPFDKKATRKYVVYG